MSNFLLKCFKGAALIQAFRKQALIQCDESAAKQLAAVARCMVCHPQKKLLKQGQATGDVFFVLQGSVSVLVNGTRVATRTAGQHVGEMAALLQTRRTATVVIEEETVLAKVRQKDFSRIADHCPGLWRNLAVELAGRLHQRRNLIREPNAKPFIFIGSSTKNRDVAEELRRGLKGLDAEIQVWSDAGVFPASETFVETLACAAKESDFAIIVFGKDDLVLKGGKKHFVPRDNVVFEAGLFIGGITRARTFIVRQKNADVRILSDLAGMTLLGFRKSKGKIDTSTACAEIKARVQKLWVR